MGEFAKRRSNGAKIKIVIDNPDYRPFQEEPCTTNP